MRRSLLIGALSMALVLSLTACAGSDPQAGPVSSPTQLPVPTPSASPSALPSPTPTLSAALDPTSDEALDAYYAARGWVVLSREPYGEDLLVWYGPQGSAPEEGTWSSFAWYYGDTGVRVELPVPDTNGALDGHEILGRGQLRVTTSGYDGTTGGRFFPAAYTLTADPDTASCLTVRDPWQPLNRKIALGTSSAEGGSKAIYDARLGLDDLSVAFMPLASEDGLTDFISGSGPTIPNTAITFDEASRVMTIRLARTVLETGEMDGGDDWVYDFTVDYDLHFPHTFPAGSLGAGNRFVDTAALSVDGDDAVLSLHLTENASFYTVETGELENDMYPYLRVVFRDRMDELDQ